MPYFSSNFSTEAITTGRAVGQRDEADAYLFFSGASEPAAQSRG